MADELAARALESLHEAKKREIATHQQAERLHAEAAEAQQRMGHDDRAQRARERAAAAHERIALAEEERREVEQKGHPRQ